MKKSFFCIIFFILISTNLFCVNVPITEDLSKKDIILNVTWDFYKGKFIAPDKFADVTPDQQIIPPWIWNDYYQSGLGCGTFHVTLQNLKPNYQYALFMFDAVGTAFNLFVNKELTFVVGKPNEDFQKSKGDHSMEIINVTSTDKGELDLVIQASNDFYREGGLWGTIRFGEVRFIKDFFIHELNKCYSFFGLLFFVILFHLTFFLLRRDDRSSLYLALFTLAISLRIAVQGFSLVKFYFPNIPYSIVLKLEYFAIYISPALYASYLRNLYGKESFKNNIDVYIIIANVVFMVLAWLLPVYFVNRLVPFMQLDFIVCTIVLVRWQFKISKKNKDSSNTIIMAYATGIVALFAFHDIFALNYVQIFLPNTNLLPYSVLIFVTAQSIITARNRELALLSVQKMSNDLKEINDIYYKFVPKEFLALLGKNNITDVALDEKKERKLTLMSVDVRHFTSMSQRLSEDAIFKVLNKYFSTVGPIIRKHRGFIEKYLGDGIVVLFPEDGKQALECAIEMQEAVRQLCVEFDREFGEEFHVGIGIHYGTVVLMTVGEKQRMTGLTISSAVNATMRLESLTKKYLKPILFSKSYLDNAKFDDRYKFTYVDTITFQEEDRQEELYTIEI